MNNFGVVELANTKTTSAPGWAYVADYGPSASASAAATGGRKRGRNAAGPTLGDLTARQEAKIRKDLEALDRDAGKDSAIPLPARPGRAQVKHTPNVRKILQSQKTFANHLDDFIAAQSTPAAAAAPARQQAPNAAQANKRHAPAKKEYTPRQVSVAGDGDVAMEDADAPPLLSPPFRAAPLPHPGDDDPLLTSRVPDIPSSSELRELLAHPPLSYLEARGTWEATQPSRVFCELCGYWGRVRCTKCGTRVCALECLETHREECVTRYGL